MTSTPATGTTHVDHAQPPVTAQRAPGRSAQAARPAPGGDTPAGWRNCHHHNASGGSAQTTLPSAELAGARNSRCPHRLQLLLPPATTASLIRGAADGGSSHRAIPQETGS